MDSDAVTAGTTQENGPAPPGETMAEATGRHMGIAWLGARELILLWSVWLLGSWTMIWMTSSPRAGARLMLFSLLLGLCWAWPALRLSHGWVAWFSAWKVPGLDSDDMVRQAERYAPVAVWIEWLVLVIVMQAVVWPLRLIGGWGFEQTLWLDATLIAWSALCATAVAWAVGVPRPTSGFPLRRAVAMVICLLLVVGQPMLMALGLGGAVPDGVVSSPVPVLWDLGIGQADAEAGRWVGVTGAALLAGVCGAVITLATGLWPQGHD